jgi:UDP-2,3-diacylglucosamine pyrophosphatase LpxH
LPAKTAAHGSPDKFQRQIARGLDRAYTSGETETHELDLDDARLVIFSDHHKGTRDGADDFQRCERAYSAALGYYLEQGYRLIALGDVEELWENDPEPVLDAYAQVLSLEAAFHAAGRYERFWGNHDDHWRYATQVSKRLGPLFPDLVVREALKLSVTSAGQPLGLIFLVHGHQGTLDSERWGWFSRLAVRYLWRPLQRRLNLPSTTPAQDWKLRNRHEEAMFLWASGQEQGVIVIAGHTHRPVFRDSGPGSKLARSLEEVGTELTRARRDPPADAARIAQLRAELEFAEAEARREERKPIEIKPPCYFNTGCCSFGDGDITGIEIANGEIRLVRWPDQEAKPLPQILASADLRAGLEEVAPRPGA